MLVRKWNDFHLLYSFATKSMEHTLQTSVINEINTLLKIGDYVYSSLRQTYAEYCGEYTPPKIECFHAFEGRATASKVYDRFCALDSGALKRPFDKKIHLIVDNTKS